MYRYRAEIEFRDYRSHSGTSETSQGILEELKDLEESQRQDAPPGVLFRLGIYDEEGEDEDEGFHEEHEPALREYETELAGHDEDEQEVERAESDTEVTAHNITGDVEHEVE
jgi:hypothetical protein